MALILGCGSVGQRVEKLERKQGTKAHCICKTEQSLANLQKQGVDATALNLEHLKNSKIILEHSQIYYFIPPPSKGIKDTTITQLFNHLAPHTLKKIILISTTGVYGNCNGDWLDENTPVNPQADRAKRRLNAEKQLQTYCQKHNIDYTILRVPGIYGAEKLPRARLEKKQPILTVSESPFSNRIHIDDLAHLAFKCMHHTLPQKIYNIADNQPSSMSQYFINVAKALNLAEPTQISLDEAKQTMSANMISYLVESKRINNKALLTDLNYQLKYPHLDSGLKNI
jgi:nucleoside-diphosphate-sugar epimerase